MAIYQVGSQNYLLYACLPFVELADETPIHFGPVVFWPASKFKEYLPDHLHSSFHDYFEIVSQIKTESKDPGKEGIETEKLNLRGATCVSIAEDVAVELREYLLIDSLYLLYFTSIFRHLYYGQEITTFNAFRKMIPAYEDFIKVKGNWEQLSIKEKDREGTISLHFIDPEICQGLGMALESIYLPKDEQDPEFIQAYKRLVRSIRYLVDRFFQRFVNLFHKGLHFSEEMFEPEDVIFLASSFESLFNLDASQSTAADFKHKLRPLLHLKYSRPVEIFWKWVDDFYEVKRRILQGEIFLDPLFKRNPNFEISHILLGIKLFIYSVYYYLFKYQLLKSTHVDSYTPPDFKWIHPEEILLFFWTETSVLEKIHLFLNKSQDGTIDEESLADLNLLTTLFVSLYDRYYLAEQHKGEANVLFIPSPITELQKEGYSTLEKLKQLQAQDSNHILLQFIHPYFIGVLEDRLEQKKLE